MIETIEPTAAPSSKNSNAATLATQAIHQSALDARELQRLSHKPASRIKKHLPHALSFAATVIFLAIAIGPRPGRVPSSVSTVAMGVSKTVGGNAGQTIHPTHVHHQNLKHHLKSAIRRTPPTIGTLTVRSPHSQRPQISQLTFEGQTVNMTWKSIKDSLRYKVYAASAPNLKNAAFVYSFSLDPQIKGFTLLTSFNLNQAQSNRVASHSPDYRYWAIAAVDRHGNESSLSDVIDTTPATN